MGLRAHEIGKVGKIVTFFSVEVTSLLQSEMKVTLLLLESRFFLLSNLCFGVKFLNKATIIVIKMHKNE